MFGLDFGQDPQHDAQIDDPTGLELIARRRSVHRAVQHHLVIRRCQEFAVQIGPLDFLGHQHDCAADFKTEARLLEE